MTGEEERVELFADDFSSYPLTEKMDAEYFAGLTGEKAKPGARLEVLGPWRQTSLHYSWKSARIQGYLDASLPWRLTERDGRRWLEQPEDFFNVVFMAGDAAWEDYVLQVDLAVCDGPAGPIVRYQTSRRNTGSRSRRAALSG